MRGSLVMGGSTVEELGLKSDVVKTVEQTGLFRRT